MGLEACLQAQQIEQVKFPLVQFGPVIRRHQQFMTHKGFGSAAAVDSLKPHHKQRLAGQLPAFFELDFCRFNPLATAQPAGPRCREPLGEFHLLDLLGLEARLESDSPAVGTVSDLISGGNDLLEITTSEGRKLLIPFVEAIVPEVHLEEGWLLLTPPPGLLEL